MSQYIRVLNLYEQIYENIHITKQYRVIQKDCEL